MTTVICLVSLKFLLQTYFDYFWVLATRREYSFSDFHGKTEIPLAIIVIACLMFHIYYGLKRSTLILLDFTQQNQFISCKEAISEITCRQMLNNWGSPDDPSKPMSVTVLMYWFKSGMVFNLVFLSFFIFRRPHDCFECLSLNQKLRISIF